MRSLKYSVILGAFIFTTACGADEPASDDTVDDVMSATDDGWTVVVTVLEPPLEVGAERFGLQVTDSAGAVKAEAFEVDAFMSAHGHGTMVPTETTNTDAGGYEATVTFSMPGPWEVRVNTDADRFFEFPVEVLP